MGAGGGGSFAALFFPNKQNQAFLTKKAAQRRKKKCGFLLFYIENKLFYGFLCCLHEKCLGSLVRLQRFLCDFMVPLVFVWKNLRNLLNLHGFHVVSLKIVWIYMFCLYFTCFYLCLYGKIIEINWTCMVFMWFHWKYYRSACFLMHFQCF